MWSLNNQVFLLGAGAVWKQAVKFEFVKRIKFCFILIYKNKSWTILVLFNFSFKIEVGSVFALTKRSGSGAGAGFVNL
jgi:hypothetical protein